MLVYSGFLGNARGGCWKELGWRLLWFGLMGNDGFVVENDFA
jgi:hypothetical protein